MLKHHEIAWTYHASHIKFSAERHAHIVEHDLGQGNGVGIRGLWLSLIGFFPRRFLVPGRKIVRRFEGQTTTRSQARASRGNAICDQQAPFRQRRVASEERTTQQLRKLRNALKQSRDPGDPFRVVSVLLIAVTKLTMGPLIYAFKHVDMLRFADCSHCLQHCDGVFEGCDTICKFGLRPPLRFLSSRQYTRAKLWVDADLCRHRLNLSSHTQSTRRPWRTCPRRVPLDVTRYAARISARNFPTSARSSSACFDISPAASSTWVDAAPVSVAAVLTAVMLPVTS